MKLHREYAGVRSDRLWPENPLEKKRWRSSSQWRWWKAWRVELRGTQGKVVSCRGAESWVIGNVAAGRRNKSAEGKRVKSMLESTGQNTRKQSKRLAQAGAMHHNVLKKSAGSM